jgi:hypothetical protein
MSLKLQLHKTFAKQNEGALLWHEWRCNNELKAN